MLTPRHRSPPTANDLWSGADLKDRTEAESLPSREEQENTPNGVLSY
jgi:hypothetical protein